MKHSLVSAAIAALCIVEIGATAPMPQTGYTLRLGSPALLPQLRGASLGFGPHGLLCARSGPDLFVGTTQKVDTLPFGSLARIAIERDILDKGAGGGKWDGKWDQSVMADSTVRFDDEGRAYTLLIPRYSQLKSAVLLWSGDGCRNWSAVALTGRNATMERADSFNSHAGPPTIVSYENYGNQSGTRLWLDLFRFQSGAGGQESGGGQALVRVSPAPNLIASNSALTVDHSGGGNSTFTTADRIVVAYPTTDTSGPGTQAVTREFDLRTQKWLSGPLVLGRSKTLKGPDDHDIPVITKLPSGKLLALINAHHANFQILESRQAGTSMAGWGKPVFLGGMPDDQYSYGSLNVTPSGIVNVIARAEWRQGYYDLVQLRRMPDGQWQTWNGMISRSIATPDRHQYAVWHQHVSVDPNGVFYLSFAYIPNRLTAPEAQSLGMQLKAGTECSDDRCWYLNSPVIKPMTLVSKDDGASWQ